MLFLIPVYNQVCFKTFFVIKEESNDFKAVRSKKRLKTEIGCVEKYVPKSKPKKGSKPKPLGSVSASGTGRIRLESPRPAMPDTEPILTGMAPCPALHFSYQFLGCKK